MLIFDGLLVHMLNTRFLFFLNQKKTTEKVDLAWCKKLWNYSEKQKITSKMNLKPVINSWLSDQFDLIFKKPS